MSLPAGYGKSTIACELSHRLGCEGVVHEWRANESLTPGWLHLTNAGIAVNSCGSVAPVDIRSDRERNLLAAMAAILLEVCDNPEVKPHSSDSYLPEHLIADAVQALQPYGWPV